MSTFGNTNSGSNYDYQNITYTMGGKFTLEEAGDVSKLTAFITNNIAGHAACNIKGILRAADGAGGAPGTLKGVSVATAVADAFEDNKDFSFSSAVSLTAADYWLLLLGDASAAGCAIFAQATTGGASGYAADTYASPDDPLTTWNGGAYVMCMYGTYTPTASGLLIPAPRKTPLYPQMHMRRSMRQKGW